MKVPTLYNCVQNIANVTGNVPHALTHKLLLLISWLIIAGLDDNVKQSVDNGL